jgi:hypothetical protein
MTGVGFMHLDFRRFKIDSKGSSIAEFSLYVFVPTSPNHHDLFIYIISTHNL